MTDAPNRSPGRPDHQRERAIEEHLAEELDEKRATEDPITAREAFELEAEEEGLSDEAADVGDET